jgi:hypothetical protein
MTVHFWVWNFRIVMVRGKEVVGGPPQPEGRLWRTIHDLGAGE